MMNWLGGLGGPMGMNMGMGMGRFSQSYKAFSAPFFEGADAEKINEINYGGKILLPSSALDSLIRLNIQYPMLFKLSNTRTGSSTHCGVLEFSAQEGRVYLPQWLMQQLHLEEGQLLNVESATLPKATYARLKPQNIDFLQITNPRAVLEVEMRKFACLSTGDRISVRYNEQTLEFLVMELKPGDAVCIIECDVNLEFDAPEGYVDEHEQNKYKRVEKPAAPSLIADESEVAPVTGKGFSAFHGSGARLDGKTRKGRTESTSSMSTMDGASATPTLIPVVPKEDYVPGRLSFPRYDYKCRVEVEKELMEETKRAKTGVTTSPFEGQGTTLRARK